ncbi:hypothetical protein ACWCHM_29890 [Micromonospora sp. SCSIO 07396]
MDRVAQTLGRVYAMSWPAEVARMLITPRGDGGTTSIPQAYELLARFGVRLPAELVPLAIVDEGSMACTAVTTWGAVQPGEVLRLHLSDVDPDAQLRPLDIDPLAYVMSLKQELGEREEGLRRILDEIGPAYQANYLQVEKRPRDYVVRPVRIACQNVIVGLAAIAQDSAFDGLSVVAWQTCELPHVATHEGNRTLAALTLCDAFRNGGTMEIRFDRDARVVNGNRRHFYRGHPEKQVPASLRRFGRTVGVALGAEDPAAITPAEARELFLAIAPMPGGLARRVREAVETYGMAPERICFALLSQVWREIEVDYLLATSARAASVLEGGAPWQARGARQAESVACRAAVMVGMLFRRLDSTDRAAAGAGEARVVEDRRIGIGWSIDDESGVVTFTGLTPGGPLPWTHGESSDGTLRVRPFAPPACGQVDAVVVPSDTPAPDLPAGVALLRCPERLPDIDKNIETRLLSSRISR